MSIFANSESDEHHEAKIKLFDILKAESVFIVDQNKKKYKFNNNDRKNYFLNIEYPLFGGTNKAVGINNYYPCCYLLRKKMNIENVVMLCEGKDKRFLGANEHSPCMMCVNKNIMMNINDKKDAKPVFDIIPDISYGIDGKHLIWFEVIHKHKCTKRKIDIANRFGIKIFEFNFLDIINLKEGEELNCKYLNVIPYEDYIMDSRKLVNLNVNRQNSSVKEKLIDRKDFSLKFNDEFKLEISKLKYKVDNDGFYFYDEINEYFKGKLKDDEYAKSISEESIQKHLDYTYRYNGCSIISPNKYKESTLKNNNISYYGERKIVVSKTLAKRVYEIEEVEGI